MKGNGGEGREVGCEEKEKERWGRRQIEHEVILGTAAVRMSKHVSVMRFGTRGVWRKYITM
jgi:hypothetical protein